MIACAAKPQAAQGVGGVELGALLHQAAQLGGGSAARVGRGDPLGERPMVGAFAPAFGGGLAGELAEVGEQFAGALVALLGLLGDHAMDDARQPAGHVAANILQRPRRRR